MPGGREAGVGAVVMHDTCTIVFEQIQHRHLREKGARFDKVVKEGGGGGGTWRGKKKVRRMELPSIKPKKGLSSILRVAPASDGGSARHQKAHTPIVVVRAHLVHEHLEPAVVDLVLLGQVAAHPREQELLRDMISSMHTAHHNKNNTKKKKSFFFI